MKANRFLNTVFRFGVLTALVICVSGVSLAQVVPMPLSPGANTQFGRLSWYPSLTNFDGFIAGPDQFAFGVYGQANNQTSAPNPNGHGWFGFGSFGYTGANGLFGAAGHSVISGAKRNVGMWALAANSASAADLLHTSADTASTGAVGLEVGAGGGAGALGHNGIAILVDSGDVYLDAGNNTTTVKNLKVNGKFFGGNDYQQALSTDAVSATAITTAVLEADATDVTNTNPVFKATSAATSAGGPVILASNSGGTGVDLLTLKSGATTVINVNNKGDLTLTDNSSTSGTITAITAGGGSPTTGSEIGLSVSKAGLNGYGTTLTRTTDGKKFQLPGTAGPALDAALGVTRGADIDTLNISGQLQFSNPTTVDFKGATIKNMSGNNLFTQSKTADPVTISTSTNAGIEIQMNTATAANADPAIIANQSTTATGLLLELEKNAIDVFTVGNTGQAAITDVTASGTSLTISQTNSAAKALSVTSHNGTSFGSRIDKAYEATAATNSFTIPTGPLVPSVGITTGSASLVVNRGAIIDTLDISGNLQFGNTTQKASVDFSNATVTGLSFNDTNKVSFHPGTVQKDGTTNPSIFINKDGITTATGDLIKLQSDGNNVFDIDKRGNTTITPNGGSGPALTVTGANGTDGIDATGNGAGKAGISAKGTGGANAILIDGGVATNGTSNQPSGNANATILIGTRTITITVNNSLVTGNSNILCSVQGTAGDSYTATVTSRVAGTSFNVKVTCVEGDVPAAEATNVSYWIVN